MPFTIVTSVPAALAVKSALILAAAMPISLLMRNRSAGARHLVWTAALSGVLLLPLLTFIVPALRIATPSMLAETSASFQASGTAQRDSNESSRSAPITASSSRQSVRPNWTTIALWIWSLGTAAALLRLSLGYHAILRLRRKSRPLPIDGCQVDGLEVDVLESGAGTMPMTIGLLKPAILLPSDALDWTDDRRRAVLLHELAHVQRRDPLMQLVARAALAVYWWNPLAWTAWREFVKERERAADDLVLAAGIRASDYAAHLLEAARAMKPAFAMSLAMARRSQLEGRLLAILDAHVTRRAPGRAAASIAAVAAIAIIAPLAAMRAQETPAIPADVDATIRAAQSQHDHAMLERIAAVAQDQRKYDLARTLLTAALEIRGETSGTGSEDYGLGVLKLADLAKHQTGVRSAEPLYAQALPLLGTRAESATALINLGQAALLNKNLDAAAGYFGRAQSADPSKAGIALMWLAEVRARQGNAAEADTLFKSAIAAQDPASLNAAIIDSVYAQFLAKQQRGDEAADLRTKAESVYTAQITHKPAAAGSTAPYKIGGAVGPPKLLSKVEPEYSDEARAAALAGEVMLSLVVGTDGVPRDITVVRPLGLGLDEKAIEAVGRWRFAPGVKDGVPVPVIANIIVNFRLL